MKCLKKKFGSSKSHAKKSLKPDIFKDTPSLAEIVKNEGLGSGMSETEVERRKAEFLELLAKEERAHRVELAEIRNEAIPDRRSTDHEIDAETQTTEIEASTTKFETNKIQCQILSLSRSSFYYRRKGESTYNLELMTLIDKQFLETPFKGVRQMTWHLKGEGHKVNKKRIRRLMPLMGLMPIYQKPNTSKPNKAHQTYPYLLGGVKIIQPNHVWCADITYIPCARAFYI